MIELKDQAQTCALRYDGDIFRYVAYVKGNLEGLVARKGEFLIPKANNGKEKLDCVSIDSIPGLPKEFSADLIPKLANGGYYMDLIVYTDRIEKDKFTLIPGGMGRAKVRLDNDITAAIYGLLMPGMKDLTLMPITLRDGQEAILEHLGRVHQRLVENRDSLYLYCTSNIDGRSAFVVHIPNDPYKAFSLVKKWLEAIEQLKDASSNKQNP